MAIRALDINWNAQYPLVRKHLATPMPAGKIRMGIELEFSYADSIIGDDDYLIMKTDCSLPVTGAEFATRPDYRENHIKHLDDFLKINPRDKLRVNSSCGMHVHVDARSWKSTEAKNFALQRLRDHKSPQFIFKYIARRRENAYWSLQSHWDRYYFYKLGDLNTIEFRLFSGTRNIKRINRRLKWLEALVKWSNDKASNQVIPTCVSS